MKGLKLKKICLHITYLLFISILISCTFSNAPLVNSEMIKTVKNKTTMLPFSHLEQPGVFIIGTYSKNSIFSSKSKMIGIIIIVEDFKTNEIFDWCFYKGIEGFVNVTPTRMGTEMNFYYIPCYNSNKLLKLDSETSQISEIPLDEHIYAATKFDFNNCKSDYNVISMSASHATLHKFGRFFRVYNSITDTFSKPLFIDYDFYCADPTFYPENNNKIWFAQSLINEKNLVSTNVRNIDLETLTISEPIFILTGNDEPISNALYGNDYTLNLINDDYLFFIKYLYNSIGVTIVDAKSKNYEEKYIPLPNVCELFDVNGELYCLSYKMIFENNEAIHSQAFYKLNLETYQAEKLTEDIEFSLYYGEFYVYDDKIIVAETINQSDITYFYFDTKTNKISDIYHFEINDFLSSLY